MVAEEDKHEDAKWPESISLVLSPVWDARIQLKARLGK